MHSGAERRSYRLLCLAASALLLLQACSGGDVPQIPAQHWQDARIELQTRPLRIRPGMNEFLVIATDSRGLPVHDMVVSLRMDEADPWSQTMQDGFSGVFRRAIRVESGQERIFVQLRRDKKSVTLEFPLTAVIQTTVDSG
jgi:hypothetical protein